MEGIIGGAGGGVAGGNVGGSGQEPGLGKAVAFLGYVLDAVQMRDGRHRAGVWPGGAVEGRASVAPVPSTGGIGPVQRGIDGQQMWQVAPGRILEIVDPLHAYGSSVLGLDGACRVG